MNTPWLLAIIAALALCGYFLAQHRAVAAVAGKTQRLHSRPVYHGFHAALAVTLPSLVLLIVMSVLQPVYVNTRVDDAMPDTAGADAGTKSLVQIEILQVVEDVDTAIERGLLTEREADALLAGETEGDTRLEELGIPRPDTVAGVLTAAAVYRDAASTAERFRLVLVLIVAGVDFAWASIASGRNFRARNAVERMVTAILIAAASIAIFTTIGIVLSMLFETISFFDEYPWQDFLFGLNWSRISAAARTGYCSAAVGNPLGSFVALCVAVPVGLMAATYPGEYASPRNRAIAKPLLEILAGIPTIVYGIFALIVVGPLLRDYFAEPLSLSSSSSSVMTAGLVMGIMLIPFVSSLSDDVITAVPQAMRDGSLGVGATQSKTIGKVVLPAALPGIVGAILLAASRAIGETMIVVLGAGAAARLSLNPFEAMTTVTVKIVSQLTGDTDFASPETLVAFALGFTLFLITLGLNVFALWIVRRYREQYE